MDRDEDLVRRYLLGDAGAADRLVDRHGPLVYAFVRRFLGQASNVDDVAQDAWLRALRGLPGFDGRARFTTWLVTVVRSACLDALRRVRREVPPAGDEPGLLDVADPGPPVLDRVARRELGALLERAVAALPAAQREVFLLREQTALTFEEIARVVGEPRETVKSRMRYALAAIRRFVRDRVPARGGADRGL